jgi:O-phospho-L-seryl-tRNASec:L-selenocysteinyl-tRNA synthase
LFVYLSGSVAFSIVIDGLGLTPVVIENVLEGDQLVTDLEELERQMLSLGESVACVLSTTSCFAPRGYDKYEGFFSNNVFDSDFVFRIVEFILISRVEEIAALCQKHNMKHVINNAYGLQDSKCAHIVNEAMRMGEVSYVVQSTDKVWLFACLFGSVRLFY